MFSARRQGISKKFGLAFGEADALVARLWKYFFSLELEATTAATRGETTYHFNRTRGRCKPVPCSIVGYSILEKRIQACRATVAYPRETRGGVNLHRYYLQLLCRILRPTATSSRQIAVFQITTTSVKPEVSNSS